MALYHRFFKKSNSVPIKTDEFRKVTDRLTKCATECDAFRDESNGKESVERFMMYYAPIYEATNKQTFWGRLKVRLGYTKKVGICNKYYSKYKKSGVESFSDEDIKELSETFKSYRVDKFVRSGTYVKEIDDRITDQEGISDKKKKAFTDLIDGVTEKGSLQEVRVAYMQIFNSTFSTPIGNPIIERLLSECNRSFVVLDNQTLQDFKAKLQNLKIEVQKEDTLLESMTIDGSLFVLGNLEDVNLRDIHKATEQLMKTTKEYKQLKESYESAKPDSDEAKDLSNQLRNKDLEFVQRLMTIMYLNKQEDLEDEFKKELEGVIEPSDKGETLLSRFASSGLKETSPEGLDELCLKFEELRNWSYRFNVGLIKSYRKDALDKLCGELKADIDDYGKLSQERSETMFNWRKKSDLDNQLKQKLESCNRRVEELRKYLGVVADQTEGLKDKDKYYLKSLFKLPENSRGLNLSVYKARIESLLKWSESDSLNFDETEHEQQLRESLMQQVYDIQQAIPFKLDSKDADLGSLVETIKEKFEDTYQATLDFSELEEHKGLNKIKELYDGISKLGEELQENKKLSSAKRHELEGKILEFSVALEEFKRSMVCDPFFISKLYKEEISKVEYKKLLEEVEQNADRAREIIKEYRALLDKKLDAGDKRVFQEQLDAKNKEFLECMKFYNENREKLLGNQDLFTKKESDQREKLLFSDSDVPEVKFIDRLITFGLRGMHDETLAIADQRFREIGGTSYETERGFERINGWIDSVIKRLEGKSSAKQVLEEELSGVVNVLEGLELTPEGKEELIRLLNYKYFDLFLSTNNKKVNDQELATLFSSCNGYFIKRYNLDREGFKEFKELLEKLEQKIETTDEKVCQDIVDSFPETIKHPVEEATERINELIKKIDAYKRLKDGMDSEIPQENLKDALLIFNLELARDFKEFLRPRLFQNPKDSKFTAQALLDKIDTVSTLQYGEDLLVLDLVKSLHFEKFEITCKKDESTPDNSETPTTSLFLKTMDKGLDGFEDSQINDIRDRLEKLQQWIAKVDLVKNSMRRTKESLEQLKAAVIAGDEIKKAAAIAEVKKHYEHFFKATKDKPLAKNEEDETGKDVEKYFKECNNLFESPETLTQEQIEIFLDNLDRISRSFPKNNYAIADKVYCNMLEIEPEREREIQRSRTPSITPDTRARGTVGQKVIFTREEIDKIYEAVRKTLGEMKSSLRADGIVKVIKRGEDTIVSIPCNNGNRKYEYKGKGPLRLKLTANDIFPMDSAQDGQKTAKELVRHRQELEVDLNKPLILGRINGGGGLDDANVTKSIDERQNGLDLGIQISSK